MSGLRTKRSTLFDGSGTGSADIFEDRGPLDDKDSGLGTCMLDLAAFPWFCLVYIAWLRCVFVKSARRQLNCCSTLGGLPGFPGPSIWPALLHGRSTLFVAGQTCLKLGLSQQIGFRFHSVFAHFPGSSFSRLTTSALCGGSEKGHRLISHTRDWLATQAHCGRSG